MSDTSAAGQTVAVGVCTYKRTALLRRCLASLSQAVIPTGVAVPVVVADNDPAQSARGVVEQVQRETGLKLHYIAEPRRGIPYARNAVLQVAADLQADALAFIDDDEFVHPQWITAMLQYYTANTAEVVRGYVQTTYPPATPDWICCNGVYQRRNYRSGREFSWASTNNVIFDFGKLVQEWGLRFDEQFGLSGGSDRDFFNRAHRLGARILWNADAVVYEDVEGAKLRRVYYLLRKFREGNDRTKHKGRPVHQRMRTAAKAVRDLVLLTGRMGMAVVKHNTTAWVIFGKLASKCGELLGAGGIHFVWQEYKK